MRNLWLGLLLLTSSIGFAQSKSTSYILLNAGYENWQGSWGNLGAELYLVQNNHSIIAFSANANMGYMQDRFRVIPEAGIGYLFNFKNNGMDPYSSNMNASFYSIRAEVSPWTISPKAGIAVLGLLEFNAGYAFEFNENKNFKSMEGFRFGLKLHLPTQLF